MKIYTVQINAFGNLIICGDTKERNGYEIVFESADYNACIIYKADYLVMNKRIK